jgi:hypothetical protein
MTKAHVMENIVFQLSAYVELLDRGSPGWTDRIAEWQKNGTVFGKLFPGLSLHIVEKGNASASAE